MTDARTLADVVAVTLLDAVSEGLLSAGGAADLARRIADGAASHGVSSDALLDLTALGSRR
jgi:hypothetical protein